MIKGRPKCYSKSPIGPYKFGQYKASSAKWGALSLVPRPLQDFISQPWRKIGSPQLQDKIWEWPGDEAREPSSYAVHAKVSPMWYNS